MEPARCETIRGALTVEVYGLAMAYDPGQIDATLAAAVGDDPVLIAELRAAFLAGVDNSLTALAQAQDEAAWRDAAWRLKGLAGSFGAVRLMELAKRVVDGAPGDPALLKRVRHAATRL